MFSFSTILYNLLDESGKTPETGRRAGCWMLRAEEDISSEEEITDTQSLYCSVLFLIKIFEKTNLWHLSYYYGKKIKRLWIVTNFVFFLSLFRYKPFFPFQVQPVLGSPCDTDLSVQDSRLVEGRLKVTLIECSRWDTLFLYFLALNVAVLLVWARPLSVMLICSQCSKRQGFEWIHNKICVFWQIVVLNRAGTKKSVLLQFFVHYFLNIFLNAWIFLSLSLFQTVNPNATCQVKKCNFEFT